MDENIILIDWFAFTVKDVSPETIIGWLGLSNVGFLPGKGHYGYKSSLFFGGMWVLYDGREDMGICVEFSGQGCRQYETSGNRTLEVLICDVLRFKSANITRLDVAFDDVDKNSNGLLDVMKIERLVRRDRYISKFGKKSGSWSGNHNDGDEKSPLAYSVYLGSPQSDVRFRIYDKAMERGGLDYHWVRFELQLRRSAATNFITTPGTVGYKFCGVVNNYLRFIVPNKSDSNRRRWASPEWWAKFLSYTEKISVFTKKDVDYNLASIERYILHQAGNTIYTYIKCLGWQQFHELILDSEHNLNVNQEQLISEYTLSNEEKLTKYRAEKLYSVINIIGWDKFSVLMSESEENLTSQQQKQVAEYKDIMTDKVRELLSTMLGREI